MIDIMLNIFGFLILLFFILVAVCICLVFCTALVCFIAKIYSTASGKQNRLAKIWDEEFD